MQCGTNAAALARQMEEHADEATHDRYTAKLKADLAASIRKITWRYGVKLPRRPRP